MGELYSSFTRDMSELTAMPSIPGTPPGPGGPAGPPFLYFKRIEIAHLFITLLYKKAKMQTTPFANVHSSIEQLLLSKSMNW